MSTTGEKVQNMRSDIHYVARTIHNFYPHFVAFFEANPERLKEAQEATSRLYDIFDSIEGEIPALRR